MAALPGPRRISIVGNSGSGKTTLARSAAARLGLPHTELDAEFHLPGWTELPVEEFRRVAAEVASGDGWVVDGNYSAVRELLWRAADTVVWLDLPRRTVMRQIVWRTLRRMVLRTELWNGNREPLSNLLSLDPMRSIIAWAWTNHAKYRERYSAATTDPTWSHLTFIRLRSQRESRRWLESLTS